MAKPVNDGFPSIKTYKPYGGAQKVSAIFLARIFQAETKIIYLSGNGQLQNMRRKSGTNKVIIGKVSVEDILKAERKASREKEIEEHGRPVSGRKMLHASKKIYNRKKMGKPSV